MDVLVCVGKMDGRMDKERRDRQTHSLWMFRLADGKRDMGGSTG